MPKRYRQRRRRGRSLRTVIFIAVATLILLALVFFVVGNLLLRRDKDKTDEEPSVPEETEETLNDPIAVPRQITAYPFELEGLDASSLSLQIEDLKKKEIRAVTLRLTDNEGRFLYSTEKVREYSYLSPSATLLSPSDIVSALKADGFFVSAYLTLRSHGEADVLDRSVMEAYEAALVCEAQDLGIDEVIVEIPSGEDPQRMIDFSARVKALRPNGCLGLSATDSFFASDADGVGLENLCRHFDLLTLLIPSVGEADTYEILSENMYYLLRYHVRLILTTGRDAELLNQQLSALDEHNVTTYMILTSMGDS